MKQNKAFKYVISVLLVLTFIRPSVFADQADMEQKQYYKNGPSPMDGEPKTVSFSVGGSGAEADGNYRISLDGVWKMTDNGDIKTLAAGGGWDGAIDADVPGSIHTALFKAGVIEDPYDSDNMKKANKYGEKNWYLKKTFEYNGKKSRVTLDFKGLCNVSDIYLNGEKIASHEGMFGGPFVDVTDTVKMGENTLVVHLKPAKDYTRTVVFNCSYGWHYAKLYPLGIWQSVTLRDLPDVTLDSPFVATADYKKGTLDFAIKLDSKKKSIDGKLTVEVIPKNFDGKTSYFTESVSVKAETVNLRYRADLPDAHLWMPNGYGRQDLYELKVTFSSDDGGVSSSVSQFGVRQLETAPFPSGERSGAYNRRFIINGVNVYMKGAGWCTIDAMMRFSREDYDRILSRAHDAGINYFRSWGGGLVETDEFYDLCDEYGICVYQEWPCCWDSTKTQPADVLYETVILGAKRLRNRPSLIVYGGGNEGEALYNDKVLNNMGKLTYEYDGTRDFWRQDGGTGSSNIVHDHIWWSGASPEHYIKTYTPIQEVNMSEYGLGSMMNLSSIAKFTTDAQLSEWPLKKNNPIKYHTATFDGYYGWNATPYGYDIDTHLHYASAFIEVNGLADLVKGSQLAQAQADYPLAINERIKAPYSSVNAIYKLNDNYPGASWSIIDWYGAPKTAYYLMQDAYRPIMAAALADHYNTHNSAGESSPLELPVYVLDDVEALRGRKAEVTATAYGQELNVVKTEKFDVKPGGAVIHAGTFSLTAEQTDNTPLILTYDLSVDGAFYNRTYMYYNYERDPGCLFYLPRTSLEYTAKGNEITVKNTGKYPALGVQILSGEEDTFVVSDNMFLLAAGESQTVTVNDISKFEGVTCFNPLDKNDKTAPQAPAGAAASDVTHNSAVISWGKAEDDGEIYTYTISLGSDKGEIKEYNVHGAQTSFTAAGLDEAAEYTVTVKATDNGGNVSAGSSPVKFTTMPDTTAPKVNSAALKNGEIILTFSAKMDKSVEEKERYIINNGAEVTAAKLSGDGMSAALTVSGLQNDRSYTLGIIDLKDTKKSKNGTGYVEIQIERGLYMSVDFEDEGGASYSGGEHRALIEPVTETPGYTDKGQSGRALTPGLKGGAAVKDSGYTFNRGKSITMWINGHASDGFNVLLAKGAKVAGHFEFYTRSGDLWMYAPDIGDIDLKYNINKSNNWRQLAFIFDSDTLYVYDNGEKVVQKKLTGSIKETKSDISFGVLNDGSLPYAGSIDTVRFYDRVLSPDELYSGGEYTGGTVEISGNDAGKTGNTGFSMPDGSAVNLWFKFDRSKQQYEILFAKSQKSKKTHFEIYTNKGELEFYANTQEGEASLKLNVNLNPLVGEWHMLTVAHVNNGLDVYVDGDLTNSVKVNIAFGEGEDKYKIGGLVEGGFEFPGEITEVELIDKAPDENEIKQKYLSKIKKAEEAAKSLDFENHVITLDIGQTAPLGLTGEGYEMTVSGDAAVIENGTVKAVKTGETVIRVVSADKTEISGATVKVSDPAASVPDTEQTETQAPETETTTEPSGTATDTGPVKEPEKKNTFVIPVIIGALVTAAAAAAIVIVVIRKKNKK